MSNLRISQVETPHMCKMDWAFNKPRDHISCHTTHNLHNIQS